MHTVPKSGPPNTCRICCAHRRTHRGQKIIPNKVRPLHQHAQLNMQIATVSDNALCNQTHIRHSTFDLAVTRYFGCVWWVTEYGTTFGNPKCDACLPMRVPKPLRNCCACLLIIKWPASVLPWTGCGWVRIKQTLCECESGHCIRNEKRKPFLGWRRSVFSARGVFRVAANKTQIVEHQIYSKLCSILERLCAMHCVFGRTADECSTLCLIR